MTSVYDFRAKTLQGKEISLADFRGKVLLIVNTASKCGFTPQYEGLEALLRKYRARGLRVLGFPCNQFGAPGTRQRGRDRRNSARIELRRQLSDVRKIDVNGARRPSALPVSQSTKKPGCSAPRASNGISPSS